MTEFMNLADHPANFPVSRLNGPGLRYVFWVQGCSIRCTADCLNPDYLERMPRVSISVDELAKHILNLRTRHDIEGVTILGGEPFDQAAGLAKLGQKMQDAKLSVVAYTGHTLEHIRRVNHRDWLALLGVIDILIDGPFVARLQSDHLRWRGSSNQRLIFLTKRYVAEEIKQAPIEKGVNILIRPGGTVKISGLQNKRHGETLIHSLRAKGLIE